MINKLVSVVITTHNRASLVQRAINSVLNQSYQPIELIVVDDCSNDYTEIVLRDFSNQIIYLRHKESKGGAAARMTGAKQAKGIYIAFLDDDDEWYPTKIEKQYSIAERATSKCAVVTCGATVTKNGSTFNSYPVLDGEIRPKIFSSGFITIPSNHFFNKDLFDRIGGYDLDLPAHNEHDIWMKLAEANYETKLIREPLVIIREDGRKRMMTDVNIRMEAFRIFHDKWKDIVIGWYGKKQGINILNNYMVSIYLMNAGLVDNNGDKKGARKFLIKSMKYVKMFNFDRKHYNLIYQIIYYSTPEFLINLIKYIRNLLKRITNN